jgi:hypothetical protein
MPRTAATLKSAKTCKLVIIGMALLVAGLVLAWQLWPETPLSRTAESLFLAAMEGDVDAVAEGLPGYELEALGMSPKQARALLSEYVLPTLRKCKMSGNVKFADFPGNVQGLASFDLALPSGRRIPFGAAVERTDDGASMSLENWIRCTWVVRYLIAHPDAGLELPPMYVWNMSRDGEYLLSFGCKGFAKREGGGFTPFGELRIAYERVILDSNRRSEQ